MLREIRLIFEHHAPLLEVGLIPFMLSASMGIAYALALRITTPCTRFRHVVSRLFLNQKKMAEQVLLELRVQPHNFVFRPIGVLKMSLCTLTVLSGYLVFKSIVGPQ